MKKKLYSIIALLSAATLTLSAPITAFASEPESPIETAETDSSAEDIPAITEEPSEISSDTVDTNAVTDADTEPASDTDTVTDSTDGISDDPCSASDSTPSDPDSDMNPDKIVYQDDLLTLYESDSTLIRIDEPSDAGSGSDPDSISHRALNATDPDPLYTEDEDEIYRRIHALESKYPHGMAWGMDKYWSGETVGGNNGAIYKTNARACFAFALTIQDEIFGNSPKYGYGWVGDERRPTYNDLHVGDCICMDEHAQILVKKTPTKLYWIAGNVGGKVWWTDKSGSSYQPKWEDTNYVLANLHQIITTRRPKFTHNFTCSFDTLGGPAVASITADEYGVLTLPEIPTRTGYTFAGWYTEKRFAECPVLYEDWDITKLTTGTYRIFNDTTLYAAWDKSGSAPVPTPVPTEDKLSSVKLNVSSLKLTVGATHTVTATVSPSDADVKIEWSSDNNNAISYENDSSVTAHNKSGITVTAKQPGEAAITVTATDKKYGNIVTGTVPVIVADEIKPETKTCFVGEQIDINRRYFNDRYPADSMYYSYAIQSNGAATMKNGILTAKKAGTASVTITSPQTRDILAELEFKILPKPVVKFAKPMTYKNQTLNVYDCITNIDAKDLADAQFVNFTSSKPSIASISREGVITATAPGTTKITVYIADKDLYGAMKTVSVKTSLSVKVPAFAKTSYTMMTGQKLVIAMKNVTAASDAQFVSSAPELLTAEAEIKKGKPTGKIVLKALNADPESGTVMLTAMIDEHEYTVPVNITKPTIKTSSKTLKAGKKFTIALKNTKYKASEIQWVSEDPTIASVTSGGKITALKAGTTVIYTETGGIRNECRVTVTK